MSSNFTKYYKKVKNTNYKLIKKNVKNTKMLLNCLSSLWDALIKIKQVKKFDDHKVPPYKNKKLLN